jgi:arylsulfatase A-like enzyme
MLRRFNMLPAKIWHNNRRKIFHLCLLVFLTFVFGSCTQNNTTQQPNFIFFMTDDQGYGDVGYLGHPDLRTPNIDEMARNGLQLDRFYASPVCSPSRASVLSGRHPNRSGTFTWGHALRPQEKTLARHLNEAGYQTGFFGKWHLGSVRAEGLANPGAHGFDMWVAAPNFYMNDPWMSRKGMPVQFEGEGSAVTADLALEFIEQAAGKDAPFMVFIWTGAPHVPHEATPELQELYPGQPDNLKNYYGEITGIDRAVGRVREKLRELDIAEQTLLWFTSDNGGRLPEANNGRLRGEKGELWEGGIRVPSVIEWPGQVEPRISNVPSALVDIFPTFMELAGIQPTGQNVPKDGVSLVSLINGGTDRRDHPIGLWNYRAIDGQIIRSDEIVQNIQRFQNGEIPETELNEGRVNPPDLPYEGADQYPGVAVWIDGDWKLHSNDNAAQALYHLGDDPREENNLLEENPERVTRMLDELSRWQYSVVNSMRGEDY